MTCRAGSPVGVVVLMRFSAQRSGGGTMAVILVLFDRRRIGNPTPAIWEIGGPAHHRITA